MSGDFARRCPNRKANGGSSRIVSPTKETSIPDYSISPVPARPFFFFTLLPLFFRTTNTASLFRCAKRTDISGKRRRRKRNDLRSVLLIFSSYIHVIRPGGNVSLELIQSKRSDRKFLLYFQIISTVTTFVPVVRLPLAEDA